ncbi:hatching enzyme 1.2-like [Gadus chalcogrammus]|uniref:hatching enzyme 1.2-like n=1 Tax=Gadus chalcogrammus TaxID=1042646 RepID=UPI0024C4D0F3|nr:hatching enzyme 1.2-like [Gadus chalcogrammus]XP_056463724.1 hatching enzyme 1.2-like [Gadus chalcogrammus]
MHLRLQIALLVGTFCSVQSFVIKTSNESSADNAGDLVKDEDFSVSSLLERANINVGKGRSDPLVMFGDIAVDPELKNADPCTARGCLWPRATNGKVYVPFRISNQYSARERNTIMQALASFASSTCIRFIPLDRQRDFVNIQSRSGCFSFVGRRGRAQVVSLSRQGCVFESVIQHELLHALGFNHEQSRSDRDSNVRILLENVEPGQESNFRKIQTNNLGTPYDYNSVMHYGRFAFSRNTQPTILPIPDNNAVIGRATQMSTQDISRINLLYRCNSTIYK